MEQNELLKIEFEYYSEPVNEWIAFFPNIKGMLESGETKEDAFNKLVVGLTVKLAYDNKVTLKKSGLMEQDNIIVFKRLNSDQNPDECDATVFK